MHNIVFTIPAFHLFSHGIGPITIYSYGVMMAVAFLLAILWAIREAREAGLEADVVLDLSIYVIILSIVSAHLVYILEEIPTYIAHRTSIWSILNPREGGLSFHGGVAGGALAVIYFTRRRKIPTLKLGDVVMPSLALGLAVGRIGCFLNACCYGIPSRVPWALPMPLVDAPADPHVPRHPAQLYDSALNLLLFFLLIFLKRFKRKDGDLFAFYLMLFGFSRFLVEFFRAWPGPEGSSKIFFAHLTLAQWVSFPIIAGGFLLWRLRPAAAKDKTQ